MYKYKCTNIVWDIETEDEDNLPIPKLPKTVIIEVSPDEIDISDVEEYELDDIIVDKLSDKIGWLVKSFSYEKIN